MSSEYLSPEKFNKRIRDLIHEDGYNNLLFDPLEESISSTDKEILVEIEENFLGTKFRMIIKPNKTKLMYYSSKEYLIILKKIKSQQKYK